MAQTSIEGADGERLDRADLTAQETDGGAPGRTGPELADPRPVAQLKMLQSLAGKLNQLNDVREIAEAITGELRTLIDYHNCRVHLLEEGSRILIPISFRGELTEYQGETFEALITELGQGITGNVAETGQSIYAPNAREHPLAVNIPGTPVLDESLLVVPMKYGERVVGTIALSKLGIDQFDPEDPRLLEVLASHAATAFENARLLEREREAATTARELLRLSQDLTRIHNTDGVIARALEATPSLIRCAYVAAYLRDPDDGSFHGVAWHGVEPPEGKPSIPADMAARYFETVERPFIVSRERVAATPPEYRVMHEPREVLVAPIQWEPDGLGAFSIIAESEEASFSQRDLDLARGIADLASLALGNARRFHELERFHDLVEGLEAIFWEADPDTLEFQFLSRRAGDVLGESLREPALDPHRWGDHIDPKDRDAALEACRTLIARGGDHQLEYRAVHGRGGTVWLRDIVHLVGNPQGRPQLLRGLMVDITERKRAEQALRRSERKYSEAFRREREAAQRLRALDEMKNTFLEAVSHELRTPLTKILGAAITLEREKIELAESERQDMVHLLAQNARKLQRLLSDLLDLDRLQRGIVTPNRRLTDVGLLVRQALKESDVLADRPVELEIETVVVPVDPPKVERVVENLLANAARHTPKGAPVFVRVKAHEGGALIMVEDEGQGIPRDLRDEIFEPFRQGATQGHSPGVGVGLSLVARFVELHGGRVWVEDRDGGGASFRVFLPGDDGSVTDGEVTLAAPVEPDPLQA